MGNQISDDQMKDIDYLDMIELSWTGSFFVPANEPAEELAGRCTRGEVIGFNEVTARDLNFHKCYFSLLNMVYSFLPNKFKEAVPEKHFYRFLKHLKGQYKILFEFKDGTKMVEYESISFGRMSQKRFEEYVAEQLPWIYENVIHAMFDDETSKKIIDVVEDEYQVFLTRLVG
jgi:hypothetical protein